MQDTVECKQYPEYNNIFNSNEFDISYEELNAKRSERPKARIPRKTGRFLKAIVSTVSTAGIVTAAVLLSLVVQVTSYVKGSDFLTFTFKVVNPENVDLVVSLTDENGEPAPDGLREGSDGQNERPLGLLLREDGQTLTFERLRPNTRYTLKVIRTDNGSVLLERTYSTLDGPGRQALLITPRDTYAAWNAVEVLLSYEGPLPDELSASMNGQPCRVEADRENGMIMLRGEGFAEDTDVAWELRGGDGILCEGVCRTTVGPDAAAILEDRRADPHAVRLSLHLDNPCGHPLTARLAGQEYALPADTQADAVIEVSGLEEQTSYLCTVTDNVTGAVILETQLETPAEPSAAAVPVDTRADFFGLELLLDVENEYGHPLSAAINGQPVQLDQNGRSIRLRPDGLEEDTDYTIELTDEHTGDVIYRETFRTPATPPADVTLTSSGADYFSLDLIFAVDNPYGHDLTIRLDGGTPEPFTQTAVRFDGLAEHSDHTVTIRDEHTGTDVFTDTLRTRDAGGASVTLQSSDVGFFDAVLTFDIDNPAGHTLTASVDGTPAAWAENGRTGAITLDGLDEQTAYSLSVTDETAGRVVWEGRITTPATPPADVTLASTDLTYFNMTLTFTVDNPYGHPLTVRMDNGNPAPLADADPRVTYDGLAEGSRHTVTVTDTFTGTDVWTDTLITPAAGDVQIRLKDSTADYFDAALTFTVTNPAGHKLTAYQGTTPKTLTVSGSTGTLNLTGLAEKTSYAIKIVDEFTGATVYSGTVTTKATPAATVTPASQNVGYFNIDLTFTISNPYNHSLTISLDNGTAKALTNSVSYTGLAENSKHTVTVKDTNTGTTVYTGSFTTASAGDTKVTLTKTVVNYFDAALTFTVTNPAGHKLTAYQGTTPKTLTVSGSTGTLNLTGLAEKTSYAIKIVDEFTGATVYSGTVTTKATPAATVTLANQSVGYFNIDLTFTISNPYNHNLTVSLDSGTAKALTNSVSYTGLAENSKHTVTVKDTNTGTTVYTGSFTTASAGDTKVTLTKTVVNYFDAALTFTVTNPAGHKLTAYQGTTPKTLTVSGSTGTLNLTGLSEKTSYAIKIVDEFTGATVYSGTVTTKATPAATVTPASQNVGYFNIDLTFTISNPYNHNLTVSLDSGTAKALTNSVSYTGLAENSKHTVTVKDTNTGTTVYTGSFTTASAGDTKVTLTRTVVDYFDATLTFTVTNPAGHKLTAYQGTTPKTLTVSGTTGTLNLTGLAEKTSYAIKIVDEFTGATVYSGTVTTKATPAATVTPASQNVGYFNIDLTFTISNPYNHNLTISLDSGTAKALTNSVSYTGLAENSKHTVTVKDTNTGTTVYTGSFTTASAGDTKVTLTKTVVNYFDAALTFTVTNPAGHKLTAYQGTTPKTLTVSGTTGTLNLTGLAEKTSYAIKIVDEFTGATVYSGTVTTKATPAATVTLASQSVGYFNIDLTFTISNPYNHNLTVSLDSGTAKALTNSVSYTGLAENSKHTVTVKDTNTGTTVYTGSFTTASAGDTKVTLTKTVVDYFDATLTFTVTNPAGHKLTAYQGTTPKTLTISGSTGTLNLTGLAEKTSYAIKIVDEFTGATVYSGTVTTKATPAATVTLASQNMGYTDMKLTFNVDNPYDHPLTVSLGGGAASAFSGTASYTGLTENTRYTVAVKDTKTGTTVFSATFTTRKTPAATVTLKTSDIDCFNINLAFTVSNPYGHELVVSTGGTASAFSGRVSIGGLQPRTSRTVVVTDKTAGSTVFSRTFTTNTSITFSQTEGYRVDYQIDPSFYALYPECEVMLHNSTPINPDYEYIWFSKPQVGDQTTGKSNPVVYRGTYVVELIDYSQNKAFPDIRDTFTVEIDGYTEIDLSMRVSGSNLIFTIVSGELPTLRDGDVIYLYLWDDKHYMQYEIPGDVTVTGSTFTLPALWRNDATIETGLFIPTGYSMEANVLVVDGNELETWEYTAYVGLGDGEL